ncbi:hypothetical protein ACEPPN_010228 [Leptodophora sp. 'Broadleaf-Isolate-01']
MASIQAPNIAEAPVFDVDMGEDLIMSLEFGPPRLLPSSTIDPLAQVEGYESTMGSQNTSRSKFTSKIQLIGPPSSWLGPPSLGFGLCCPASKFDSNDLVRAQPTCQGDESTSTCTTATGGDIKDKNTSGRPRSWSVRGKKRTLDPEGVEIKGAKSAKVSTAQKTTKNTTKKNTKKAAKKAIKKFSELSIH